MVAGAEPVCGPATWDRRLKGANMLSDTRLLASFGEIANVRPIPDADLIVVGVGSGSAVAPAVLVVSASHLLKHRL